MQTRQLFLVAYSWYCCVQCLILVDGLRQAWLLAVVTSAKACELLLKGEHLATGICGVLADYQHFAVGDRFESLPVVPNLAARPKLYDCTRGCATCMRWVSCAVTLNPTSYDGPKEDRTSMEPKDVLSPVCTILGCWLIADSINSVFRNGRTTKVDKFEAELDSTETEIKKMQQCLRQVSENLKRLRRRQGD